MNKKYLNFVICFIITIFFLEIFNHSSLIIETIFKSINIWFYNIVPTILPIYILIDLLSNYQGIYYLAKIFGNFMEKVFKMKKSTSFVFVLSIVSGFPSNSKYLKMLLDNQEINTKEANKLLTFTHFSNPLFIIQTIGITFLNDKQVGILILIIHYLINFLIGLFYRNYYINLSNKGNINLKQKTSFVTCLTNAIYNTIKILFLLLGIITFFMLITAIIRVNFPLNTIVLNILCGLLEMTQGLYYVSSLSIPLLLKATLMTFFISFGGISIHLQVFSILKDYKVSYSNYLFARIIHGFLSSSLVYLILNFMRP